MIQTLDKHSIVKKVWKGLHIQWQQGNKTMF